MAAFNRRVARSFAARNVAMARVLFLLLTVFAASGCASMADFRFRYSTERQARLAWLACRPSVTASERTADFADGFKAGYVDVSRGGDGACPVVPPACYWEARFQTAEGKLRLDRWYAGFTLGATTAQQCGTNYLNNVPSLICSSTSSSSENWP